jgi:hypothetical protein
MRKRTGATDLLSLLQSPGGGVRCENMVNAVARSPEQSQIGPKQLPLRGTDGDRFWGAVLVMTVMMRRGRWRHLGVT